MLISDSGGYQDQPQVLVNTDGSWSCVLTLNSAHEGQDSQRVVSTVSTDEGKHWTPIVDIEPHVAPPGKLPKSTGWVNNLLQPPSGHQLAVYTYNCDNVTTSPLTGAKLPNSNLLGCWVYRQSTDKGRTWSQSRYNLSGAYQKTDIDYSNEWGGTVLEGWSIGKPLIADDNKTVFMQFSKVSSAAGRSEGFFLRSENAISPSVRPEEITFEFVPRGNHGLRAATGSTAEEGNLVQLSDGSFYAVFRTVSGFLGRATSKDGIEWHDRLHAHYDTADYGAGMYMTELKNPTGPITPRRFSNGKFLMTVFADSQRFPDLHGFTMRDPYWIVAGWEGIENVDGGGQRKTILWSQPEILLYALPPCEDTRCGIGYPDFIETAAGDIYLTETDKKDSRVHRLPATMLEMMWSQSTISKRPTRGLTLSLPKTPVDSAGESVPNTSSWAIGSTPAGYTGPRQQVLPQSVAAPTFGNLSAGDGFTVELVLDTTTLPKTPLAIDLFDCRAAAKNTSHGLKQQGVVLRFSNIIADQGDSPAFTIELSITDGAGRNQSYHTDVEARLWLLQQHHVTTIVDGFSRTITSVTNGVFADGGNARGQGWAHLGSIANIAGEGDIEVVNGARSCTIHPAVTSLRVYDRFLLTTEAIGSWRAWKTNH